MREPCWLVTGGAGYIGAHVVAELRAAGYRAVVLDDLSTGCLERLGDEPFVYGSVLDTVLLTEVMRQHAVHGVIHAAARKNVADSFRNPVGYHHVNVDGLRSVLSAMAAADVHRIVYSSSAAVYGSAGPDPLVETAPTRPMSPYGRTKRLGEQLLVERALGGDLRYVVLRFFNVAGAARPRWADHTGTSLVGIARRAHAEGVPVVVYGQDYPTPDGTCVRDYVHVQDVARAHRAVLPLLDEPHRAATFNVGSGHGHSVLQVLAVVSRVSGRPTARVTSARREGDPAVSVASVGRLSRATGWSTHYDLADIVADEPEASPLREGREAG